MKEIYNRLFVTVMIGFLLAGVYIFLKSPSMGKLLNTVVEVVSLMAVVRWTDRPPRVKDLIIYLLIVLTILGLSLFIQL